MIFGKIKFHAMTAGSQITLNRLADFALRARVLANENALYDSPGRKNRATDLPGGQIACLDCTTIS
jgi:hypothetical protein